MVEDDVDAIIMLREELEGAGSGVYATDMSDDAIGELKRRASEGGQFDAVVTDYQLDDSPENGDAVAEAALEFGMQVVFVYTSQPSEFPEIKGVEVFGKRQVTEKKLVEMLGERLQAQAS